MASKDVIPSSGNDPERKPRDFLPQADDPFAPGDLPIDLLEFHSPSAALVNMPPTASAEYLVWLIGALTISTVIAMSVFPLNRVVTTPGRISSTQQTLVVQPLETSIIHSIDVHEGDFVHKGQVIAHLDPTITDADLDNMQMQTESYGAEVARLTAESQGRVYTAVPGNASSLQEEASFLRRKAEFDAKVHNYDEQIASQNSSLRGYQADAAMYAARAKVASDVHDMRSRLQRDQVGSRLSTLGAQNDLMEIERSQISSQQEADSTMSKLRALAAEREGYIENWRAQVYLDLSEAQRKFSSAQSDFQKASLRKKLIVLRSGEDAVVLNIAKLSIGSVIQTGNELMTLVPVGAGLEVEATLQGSQAGYVKLGDKALLKFATFPYTQYGGAEGTVEGISPDSFSTADKDSSGSGDSAAAKPDPAGDGGAFYKIRMRIDRYTLHGVPSFFHPQPGMPVTADIQVGKRTIMQFMLNSIIPMATEGMRQP